MSGVTFDPTNTTRRQDSWDGTRQRSNLFPKRQRSPRNEVKASSTLPEELSVKTGLLKVKLYPHLRHRHGHKISNFYNTHFFLDFIYFRCLISTINQAQMCFHIRAGGKLSHLLPPGLQSNYVISIGNIGASHQRPAASSALAQGSTPWHGIIFLVLLVVFWTISVGDPLFVFLLYVWQNY